MMVEYKDRLFLALSLSNITIYLFALTPCNVMCVGLTGKLVFVNAGQVGEICQDSGRGELH
jgi:hypothetical protein